MPTSATGTSIEPQRRRASGFSLLELLVVVAIIGIFAGIAVLSVGVVGTDREAEREASRLRSLLALVREEALMQNRDYGVLFSESGYRFFVYDHGQAAWLAPAEDALLQPHALDGGLGLALAVEDRPIVLDPDFRDVDPEDPGPQVMILSDGQITPFDAELSRDFDGPRFVLSAQLDGTLEVIDDERSLE